MAARKQVATKVKLKGAPPPVKQLWGSDRVAAAVAEEIEWHDTGNCGLVFAEGVGGAINSVEEAYALRRAAGMKEDYLYEITNRYTDDFNGPYGTVQCTTVPRQASAVNHLKAAGFERLYTFKNPNSSNTVTVWSALTIQDKK